MISSKWKGKQGFLRIVLLFAAACILAAGLVWLENYLQPPVFQGQESNIEFTGDSAKILNNPTYVHSSGRLAYMESWSWKRFAFAFLIQFIVLIILFPLGAGKAILCSVNNCFISVRNAFTQRPKSMLFGALLFLATGGLAFVIIRILAQDMLQKSNWMIDVFSMIVALAVSILVTFWKSTGSKPEVFFLIFTLLIGGLLAFLEPDATTISWDDGHHFQHALNYSELGSVRFTQQDMNAMETHNIREYSLGEARERFLEEQEKDYRSGPVYLTKELHIQVREFWTATQGIGLFLGRLFRLSYWMTWSLGRFTSLLAYALLGFFAIRRIQSGKMILAGALMIPQAIFLASNYSYDPGVTGFIALGLAYCFAQWQESERKITLTDASVMLGALFLGCFAKQIYFPVLLIPFFLPKEKFPGTRFKKGFFCANVGLILILLATFVIPFVFGDGVGDQRGGSDVNSFEQVRYILGHPLDFLIMTGKFMLDYINPAKASGFMTFFAYIGQAPLTVVYQLILAVVAFTDHQKENDGLAQRPYMRFIIEGILFITITLCAVSMYVSYTAVGRNWIDGVQPRYILPVIFPSMLMIRPWKIRNEISKSLYNSIIFAMIGFTGFSAVLMTCINLYG